MVDRSEHFGSVDQRIELHFKYAGTEGSGVEEATLGALVGNLVESGRSHQSGDRVALPEAGGGFSAKEKEDLGRIEVLYRERGFATPRPDELPDLIRIPTAKSDSLLDYLCQQGSLIRLGKNVVIHKEKMREAEEMVVSAIRESGSLDSADFKTLIGSSRKYALAILDYFDTVHITHRFGNKRVLHPSYLRSHPEND